MRSQFVLGAAEARKMDVTLDGGESQCEMALWKVKWPE